MENDILIYGLNMKIYDFPEKFDISVVCASGLERALKSELNRLGYGEPPANVGELSFKGGLYDICRLNLNLRTADRVYIKLAEFPANNFDELFFGAYSVPWENYIEKDGAVLVDGKCFKSKIFAVSASQRIVKKAICERMKKVYGYNSLPETSARYSVYFKIISDKAEVLLNTSGVGLHKRGYRDLVGVAPIKETLAAGLVLYSDYYYKYPFLDVFCGTGTIAIEAANIALNVAPGLNRKFDFESWRNFPKSEYVRAREEALDNEKRDRKAEIFASDIDRKAITLAERHAERAGLKGVVNFSVCDVKNLKCDLKNATVVTNPPYGERSLDISEAEKCYEAFGKAVKDASTWSEFVITPVKTFEKRFGKKADRRKKLYNSDKECYYYYYYGEKEKSDDRR